MTKRKYNWKPDLPNINDLLYRVHFPEVNQTFAPAIDLRPECSPVVNQGQIGSCTGNAIAGGVEYLELGELRQKHGPDYFGPEFQPVSRLFIYWNERAMEGDPHQDNGAMITDGITSIQQWGVCREFDWAYDPAKLFMCPRPSAYGQAAKHKNITAYRLDNWDINQLKACLNDGFPFVFGISVYSSFESYQATTTGMIPLPQMGDQFLGGHALLCVGYDDAKGCFIVKNSWGEWWGDRGYCYIPYAYLINTNLAADFWTIRR